MFILPDEERKPWERVVFSQFCYTDGMEPSSKADYAERAVPYGSASTHTSMRRGAAKILAEEVWKTVPGTYGVSVEYFK